MREITAYREYNYNLTTYARADDTFVVVWIYTDIVLLQFKSKLTEFTMLQLVLVQVRPAPNTCIYYMWKPLAACNLFKNHKSCN